MQGGRDHHRGQPAGQLARRTPVRPATGVGPPRHAARPDRSVRGAHRRRTRRTGPGRGGERAVSGAACPRERSARAATPDAGGRLDRDSDGGRGDGPDRRRGGRCRPVALCHGGPLLLVAGFGAGERASAAASAWAARRRDRPTGSARRCAWRRAPPATAKPPSAPRIVGASRAWTPPKRSRPPPINWLG